MPAPSSISGPVRLIAPCCPGVDAALQVEVGEVGGGVDVDRPARGVDVRGRQVGLGGSAAASLMWITPGSVHLAVRKAGEVPSREPGARRAEVHGGRAGVRHGLAAEDRVLAAVPSGDGRDDGRVAVPPTRRTVATVVRAGDAGRAESADAGPLSSS